MENKGLAFTSVFLCLPFVVIIAVRTWIGLNFGWEVTEYLSRAASANSPAMCEKMLSHAIGELERRNLTSGNTAVFVKTPESDIGLFYKNLTDALASVKAVEKSSELEQSNTLMKVRESIMEHGNNGDSVSGPGGLSLYPHNAIWFWFTTIYFWVFMFGLLIVCYLLG